MSKRIPWFEPMFDDTDVEAVNKCLLSGFVNQGPGARAFEDALREYFGVKHAITTPNCTTAITLSLMALGIGQGDTVLVPDITFIGTASAVRLAGAEPVLVDVDRNTFLIDPDDAERKITATTRAIVPVHLNGRSAPLPRLREIADANELAIVEDAAEATGSRSRDGFLGSLADAGCFSLAPTKIITSGQGGFVLTNRPDIRDNLVRLKDHGRLSRSSDVHPVTGYNFKFTDIQASLALSQFRKLDTRIERAHEIDRMYVDGLTDIQEIVFPARPHDGGYLMWPDFTSPIRDRIVESLSSRNITLRPFWPPLHTQPAYSDPGEFPGATEASAIACWLPCSPGITDEQVGEVIAGIRDCV